MSKDDTLRKLIEAGIIPRPANLYADMLAIPQVRPSRHAPPGRAARWAAT